LLFVIALLLQSPGFASDVDSAYGSAIRLVDKLYLHPEQVNEARLLEAAADNLSSDLHWLMVESSGSSVKLSHGNGNPIGTLTVGSMETLPEALSDLQELVESSGYGTGTTDVRLSLLQGLTDALDRYSRVMAGESLDRFNKRLKGIFVGVGAYLYIRDDVLVVSGLSLGGPAELGGVRAGDRITRIDDRSTVNMPVSEAERRLEGEQGTQVRIRVVHPGDTDESELVLTRDVVIEKNVKHSILEGNIGYVAISHVSQKTVHNLVQALSELGAMDALSRGLIMDLRGNTGGSMKEAARSADEFLTEGLLLKTVGPDGGRVQNLQAEMTATVGGHEPDSPLVVIVDERTASGSEIMAGALLELNRAGLVGSRTYGKGSVQKIYNLDDDTRLKLTVAQYILANDRKISDVGIVPDVVVGDIELDGFGVRFHGWGEPGLETAWEDVVPSIYERFGWRGQSKAEQDLPLEIARRAVISTQGTQRKDVLRSLKAVANELSAEQLGHLVSAFEHHDINWSPADSEGEPLDARVTLVGSSTEDDVVDLKVEVTNLGKTALSRVLVVLECDSLTLWSGRVIPVGRVEPQETVSGTVSVPLPPGIEAREDEVIVRLRADKHPPQVVGHEVLLAQSTPVPALDVLARLVRSEEGDHVDVTLMNRSGKLVTGPEVHFGFPGDIDVELLDHAARAPVLPANGQAHFRLGLDVGDAAPDVIPLQVHVDSGAYRRMVSWPLGLPKNGELVRLSAPSIALFAVPLAAPVGPFSLPIVVSDDTAVDHVVVFANGEKVGWAKGGNRQVNVNVNVTLREGVNRILVVTEDKGGIATRRQVVVRGEDPAAVDAGG
jgi:carboxyl-terminal processing protease